MLGPFIKKSIDFFIVDHACETMTNADKTKALLRKFAFRANKTTWLPTVPPGYSADTCAEKFPLTSMGG